MPNIVTGVLARVLLATFAEMRDWREMPYMDTDEHTAGSRAPARSTKTSHHPRTSGTLPKRANGNR